MMILLYLSTIFLIPIITGREQPWIQPYCKTHPQSWFFYRYHRRVMHKYKTWFCLESFEDKIKLCAEMCAKSTGREIESFQIPEVPLQIVPAADRDKNNEDAVESECERRITTWYEPYEGSVEELLFKKEVDKPRSGLGMDMFKCPISQMNVTFVEKAHSTRTKAKKRVEKNDTVTSRDFYLSIGRNLLTLAVLKNSTKGDNICLEDVHYYPKAEPKLDACFIENKEW